MNKDKGITFQAIFSKATTTVDGGWRVSFDLSQSEADKIADISAIRDMLLQVALVPIAENTKQKMNKLLDDIGF